MLVYQEDHKTTFPGIYRALIVAIDSTIKNGVYKVKVQPMMEGVLDDFLPYATSNLTSRYRHINLKVGDIVWVFFECGDPHYPVIFDLCNIKGKYPVPSSTYGKADKWSFENDPGTPGDLTVEYDEENKVLKLKLATNTVVLLDAKAKAINIIDENQNKILMTDAGVEIDDKNGNKIKMTSSGVDINTGNLTVDS